MSSRLAAPVRTRLTVPLYRNGYALILSSLLTSALGLGYWLIAARTYDADQLGLATGLISAMTLLANLAQLNLKGALNRFLPTAGAEAPRLTLRAYALSVGAAAVAAAVFVAGAGVFSPRLAGLLDDPLLAGWFVVSTMAWTIFVLQDAVLAGIRQAGLVPVENLTFSVAKIALLVALAAAAPVTGAFLSWSLPVVALIIPVNLFVFRRLMPAHVRATHGRARPVSLLAMAGYLAADTLAYAIWAVTIGLVPLLVLAISGPVASAEFFVLWSIAYALYLASAGMGQSLLAEASLDPVALREHARQALAESLRLVVPAVAVIVVAGPALLELVAHDYGADGGAALRWLALSAIPYAYVSAEVNIARARREMRLVVLIHAALCLIVFAVGIPLLVRFGIGGIGAGWLLAQTVVAAGLAGRARLAQRLHPRLSARFGRRVLERLRGGGDVAIYRLDGAVAHVARSARGQAALQRRVSVDVPIVEALVPQPLDAGRGYAVESLLPGRPADQLLAEGHDPDALVAAVQAAIRPLHEGTARFARIGDAELEAWVNRPLARLTALLGPRYAPALAALRAELHQTLASRSVALCTVHGDLWAGNVLLDERGEVSGIVDWEASRRNGLAEVDRMHLWLTTRARATGRELGAVVAEALRRPLRTPRIEVPARATVLLAWLAHVDANLEKSGRYARSPLWRRNAIVPVLETVSRQAAAAGRLPRAAAVARSWTLPALLAAAAGGVGLWGLALATTDWHAMSDLGLVSVLPPWGLAGLAALGVAVAVAVSLGALRPRLAGGLLATLVVVLHATPPLLYGTLRYGWAYKHVGIVDYILRHGGVDRHISALPVYHDWPGFFLVDALVTRLSGIAAMTQATWAPVFFNLADVAALLFLLRGLSTDRRVRWRAAAIFFAASWVGQDYFAPQAFAFSLYLVLLGLAVRAPTRRRIALALAVDALIVVSHPLTGVMAVIGLAALVLAGVRPARLLVVAAAAFTALWDLTFAAPFTRPHLHGVLSSINFPWATTESSLASGASLSPGQHVVALAGRGIVLAVLALAAFGTLRAYRAGRLSRAAALLAVAPVGLFAAGDYDGEMIFRIYLFGLAPLAFLAAHAFGAPTRRTALAFAAALVALLGGFVLAYYGKDHQYVFTRGELAASRFVYDNAPRGTLLIEGTPNYPANFRHYEYFEHVPISGEPPDSRRAILADPAGRLAGWLAGRRGYVILTRSQRIDAAEVGAMPVADYDRIRAALLASPRFRVAYRNRDAVVLALRPTIDRVITSALRPGDTTARPAP